MVLNKLINNKNIHIEYPNIKRDWIHVKNLSKIYSLYINNNLFFNNKNILYPSQYRLSNKQFCLKIVSKYLKNNKYNGVINFSENLSDNTRYNLDRINNYININDNSNWNQYFKYYLNSTFNKN